MESTPNVKELSVDERTDILRKIAGHLNAASLNDCKVICVRETVCALNQERIAEKVFFEVTGNLGLERKQVVNAFKEKHKELISKYQIKMGVTTALSVGSKFQTISKVLKISDVVE